MKKNAVIYSVLAGLLAVFVSSQTLAAPVPAISCLNIVYPGNAAACRDYLGDGWTMATAQSDCGAILGATQQGTFAVGPMCSQTGIVGVCTVAAGTPGESKLNFYGGDTAMLGNACTSFLQGAWSGGGTTPPPVPTLDPAVVAALTSDAVVTVTPDACTTDACMGTLFAGKKAIFFDPKVGSATKGLIIYPGGMVEPRAYAVLAHAIAAQGIAVALVPFPNKLPITDPMRGMFAALLARPWIQSWVIAGHSLGGVAAGILAKANPMGNIKGIAMLAAYPSDGTQGPICDLSTTALKAVSIAGTEDTVLNRAAYEATKPIMPAATYFVSLRGGNHAQFGYYGVQTGDTAAQISREKQHELVVGSILHLINRVAATADQDVLDPMYASFIDDTSDGLCEDSQLKLAGLRGKDLKKKDIAGVMVASETAFQSAKPAFPTDGSSRISVVGYVAQVANATDLSAPPVLDGEVWCKMKTQAAIVQQFGVTAQEAQGSCGEMNKRVLKDVLEQLEEFEGEFDDIEDLFECKAHGHHHGNKHKNKHNDDDDDMCVQLNAIADKATMSGPDFISSSVSLTEVAVDVFELQSVKLEVPTVVPAPYGGALYCKVWSPTAALKFVLSVI